MESALKQKINYKHDTKFWKVVRNLFVPNILDFSRTERYLRIAAIIPSFKPGKLSVRLVEDLIRWNEKLIVCVVDDSTPEEHEREHRIFEKIRTISDRVIVIRTPENKLKAGAINQGIFYFLESQKDDIPDLVITLDDDVVISKTTIKNLVANLLEDDRLGAVCSQCSVINKSENILTRLQGLEYFGFNAARVADEGLLYGPLVMHGMLAAFRIQALKDAGFFAEKHLIEDYEVTANIKKKGKWHVRLAPDAYAWTLVPNTFSELWRQRTRWNVGGLFVISGIRCWQTVFQDIIGHLLFLSTFLLIILSLVFYGIPGAVSQKIIWFIIVFSISQSFIWYLFQAWYLKLYKEGDWKDRFIRLSLIPEFIYANLLSVILIGSYAFFLFHVTSSWLERKTNSKLVVKAKRFIELGFAKIGYTRSWGTRTQ